MTTALLEEDISLWQELYEYFAGQWEKMFSSYRSIGVAESDAKTIIFLIIGLFLGGVIATYISAFSKRKYGRFVRRLLHQDATTPESSKTLSDLDLSKSRGIRHGVRKSTMLRRVVTCVEEEEFYRNCQSSEDDSENNAEQPKKSWPVRFWNWFIGKTDEPVFSWKDNINSAHFYIKEENSYLASSRYDKGGESLLVPIFTTIAFIIVMIVILKWMPTVISSVTGIFD